MPKLAQPDLSAQWNVVLHDESASGRLLGRRCVLVLDGVCVKGRMQSALGPCLGSSCAETTYCLETLEILGIVNKPVHAHNVVCQGKQVRVPTKGH
jgi:hypothetical protein